MELTELVAVEGNEEVQYVLLEVPDTVPDAYLQPGSTITLQGLDTATPTLLLAGVALKGEYVKNLGTLMLFQHPPAEQQHQAQALGATDAVQRGQQAETAAQPMDVEAQHDQEQHQAGGAQCRGATAAAGARTQAATSRAGCKFQGMTETRLVFQITGPGAS